MRHTERRFDALPYIAPLVKKIANGTCVLGDVNDRVIIYGRGNLGKLADEFFNSVGKKPILTIDRNTELASISEAVRYNWPVTVAIANYPYVPIEKELTDRGFGNVVPFYDVTENYHDAHPLTNGWVGNRFTDEDTENLNEVLEQWGDHRSRAHHLQFLAWHCLRQEWSFKYAPVTVHNRFFIPEVRDVLTDDEVFVDCGAHHGDVIKQFTDIVDDYHDIIAIEPDDENRGVLAGNFEGAIFDCALADKTGVASFAHGYGYCSRIWNLGKGSVVVRPLDDLDLKPTFVKLHLEGGELAALKGGYRALLQHRPIIAATVYHNDDGIWRTAHWLMDMLDDYRFLFRLHGYVGTGAVIYAIPDERK